MKLAVDCQYLSVRDADPPGASPQPPRRRLHDVFERWPRQYDDQLLFKTLEPGRPPDAELWILADRREVLLDAGPMCSLAWWSGCADADWLLFPFPLCQTSLLPGGAPCRIAALCSARDLQALQTTPLAPDHRRTGRNTRANRLQVIAQYDCLIFFAPAPENFNPPKPFDPSRIHFIEAQPAALRAVLEQCQNRFAAPAAIRSSKSPLACFTPLRPQRSGVSDYSESLLLRLHEEFEITLFLDGYLPASPALREQFAVRHQADYARWLRSNPAAQTVFVLGNNDSHKNILAFARHYPGIVELHELIPLAFGMHAGNFWSNRREWEQLAAAEFGVNFEQLRRREFENGQGFDLQPMLKTLLQNARGAIVHNQWSAQMIRQAYPALPVADTGLGVSIPPCPLDAAARGAAFRDSIGVGADQILFGVFGEINPFKRYAAIVHAFTLARAARDDLALVFAGGSDDPEMLKQVSDAVRRYGMEREIRVLGYLNSEDFARAILACDAAINLRWPTFGETSAIATQLMGAGKPVILTAKNQFLEYPDEACWKIPPGEFEPYVLAEALLELARSRALREQIGRNARNCIAQFSWDKVARKYADFLHNTNPTATTKSA